jgi:predicted transposase/invertase (TIGR01784 family)
MHSCFGIYDVKTGCQLTDKLEIHFLELPKYKNKSVKDMNRMEKWAAYFSPSTPDEELAEIAASEDAIQEAMEVEDMFTKDEVAKRSYEKAEKFRRDQAAQLKYAEEEGRKEGEKIGEEKGIKAMIAAMKELNVDKATTIDKIMAHFNLKLNAAKGYVEANW